MTPWTVAYQAPPSMGFSRQEYWSGLPFLSPGDLPDPGIEPTSPTLEADALTSGPPGKLHSNYLVLNAWLFICSVPSFPQSYVSFKSTGTLFCLFSLWGSINNAWHIVITQYLLMNITDYWEGYYEIQDTVIYMLCVYVSLSVVSDSLWTHGLQLARILSLWNSPSKDTGVGSHSLLCGIFPSQGSNPGPLHCRQIL